MQQGTVTSYERSLLYLEPASLKKQMVKLTGGEALEAKLKPYEESTVTGLDPAYLPVLTGEGLLLKPVWALKLQNGSVVILE